MYYYDDKTGCFRERSFYQKVPKSSITGIDVICGDDFAIEKFILLDNFRKMKLKTAF
ncbi:MAG: hypothetical protein LBF33_03320 [Oscillospiraceae bacterium]|nr:hypothetical protein [Oscillospiraceae bacterium]